MQSLLARQRGLLLQRLGQQHQQPHGGDGLCRPRDHVTAVAAVPTTTTSTSSPKPPRHGELITSPANRYVRHCVRLRDSSRYRWEHGSALLVGATLLTELAQAAAGGRGSGGGNGSSSTTTKTLPNARVLFVPEEDDDDGDVEGERHRSVLAALAPPPPTTNSKSKSCAVLRASGPVLRALSGVPTAGEGADGEDRLAAAVVDIPRDLVAYLKDASDAPSSSSSTTTTPAAAAAADQAARVLLLPPATQALPPSPLRLLALEGVQDPGNLGTLLRTAAAFGWRGAWLLPGCADPFGAKALRAARGAQLRSPLVAGPGAGWDALAHFAAAHNARLVAAALPGQVQKKEAMMTRRKTKKTAAAAPGTNDDDDDNNSDSDNIILVLGSEGQGLSAEALRRCDASLSVPMIEGAMESLNVAVAGGVLMFALGAGVGGKNKRRRTAATAGRASSSSTSSSPSASPAVKTLLRDIDALF